ncbi:MAG: hypothetical protein IPL40_13235 [Proteobacteria bacterium]|nr:hypothetical protein [Pseudomonadota bacterium]
MGGSKTKLPRQNAGRARAPGRGAIERAVAAPARVEHEEQATLIDPPSHINPLAGRGTNTGLPQPIAGAGPTGPRPPADGGAGSAPGGAGRAPRDPSPAQKTPLGTLGRDAVALASLVTAGTALPVAQPEPEEPEESEEPEEPEELETVMFGQRSLFREEDVRKAILRRLARDGDARTTQRGAVGSGEAALGRGAASRAGAATAATRRGESERPEEGESDAGIGRIITEKTAVAAGGSARSGARPGDEGRTSPGDPARRPPAPEDEVSLPVRRCVAERAPARSPLSFRVETTCDCRLCGRKVTWPRKRRFRGPVWSRRGFRCDRCGNVYCAHHVVRVSGWAESVIHHGRFRCQLCAIGQPVR